MVQAQYFLTDITCFNQLLIVHALFYFTLIKLTSQIYIHDRLKKYISVFDVAYIYNKQTVYITCEHILVVVCVSSNEN